MLLNADVSIPTAGISVLSLASAATTSNLSVAPTEPVANTGVPSAKVPPDMFFTAICTASEDAAVIVSESIQLVPVVVDDKICPTSPD